MLEDECVHGMNPEWCADCLGQANAGAPSMRSCPLGGVTKQEVLDEVADLLSVPRQKVSVGSSLPSEIFEAAASRVGVERGSMPAICEKIVTKAGLSYTENFDSRSSRSGGGSTVTLEGLIALRKALSFLL